MFLPAVFFVYFFLNKQKLTAASQLFLVISSLLFYSWWNISYLPLLLLSIFFNFNIAILLNKNNRQLKITSKKRLLGLAIITNLSLLIYYKYLGFFIENFNFAFSTHIPPTNLLLPLAISFFTFQQIAYLVDSYRGEVIEHNFLSYAIFVTFFPQLIAGPIVHHKEMMPQFKTIRNKIICNKNILLGLLIFSIGLFKKVILADTFSIWANTGFDQSNLLNFYEAWGTSLSFTFQLYFDFSGYSDMAIGLALLFNIKLPINFNSPYKSLNIKDFWKRWHMTLSRFLKEYVYIPLGGSRCKTYHTYTNILITFILGGIWHGAGWTFIAWGALHGIALVIYNLWNQYGIKLNAILAWCITFNFVNIAWVFFRAKEFSDALVVLKGMFGFSQMGELGSLLAFSKDPVDIILLFIIIPIILKSKNSYQIIQDKPGLPIILLSAICFSFSLASMNKISEFLYFNF